MSDSEEPQEPPPPVSESGGGGADAADVTGRPNETDQSARTMAMVAHLLSIPLGFLGPLIIWLMKKDEMRFVDDQGKEALNFQLMLLIAYVVTVGAAVCTLGLLSPLPLLVWIVSLVFAIIGGVAANDGKWYRYPVNLRMVK